MTTSTTSLLVNESLQAAGKSPRLQTTPPTATVAPAYGGAGYSVAGYSRARVSIHLGKNAPYRHDVLTCPTFDAASTYVVTKGGVIATAATPADEETMWGLIYTTLDSALAPLGYTLTVSTTSLEIIGPAGPTIFTVTGGSPVIALTTDYGQCRARLYARGLETDAGGRVTDPDDLALVSAWTLKLQPCGAPVLDTTVTVEGASLSAVPCSDDDSLRVWLSDVQAIVGDTCTGTITYRDPFAVIYPDITGGPSL